MRIKARAKINWALNVLCRRPDGYHELDMLNQRLTLADEVTLTPAQDISLTLTGSPGLSSGRDNLAWRAAALMQSRLAIPQGVHIHLHKRIPSGAGLGGGSADAAAVMLGLNRLWGMALPLEALRSLGQTLGADVPYCLLGGFARVGGTGEIIRPLPGAPALSLLLIQPRESLSTKTVFERLKGCPPGEPADLPGAAEALRQRSWQQLARFARNQLQQAAVSLCPAIQEALFDLYAQNAAFAQMSGAGSLVYGVFQDAAGARRAAENLKNKWDTCLSAQTVPF